MLWPCSTPRDRSDGIKLTNRTTRSAAAQIVVGEISLSGAIQAGPQACYGAFCKNCAFAREHTISTTALPSPPPPARRAGALKKKTTFHRPPNGRRRRLSGAACGVARRPRVGTGATDVVRSCAERRSMIGHLPLQRGFLTPKWVPHVPSAWCAALAMACRRARAGRPRQQGGGGRAGGGHAQTTRPPRLSVLDAVDPWRGPLSRADEPRGKRGKRRPPVGPRAGTPFSARPSRSAVQDGVRGGTTGAAAGQPWPRCARGPLLVAPASDPMGGGGLWIVAGVQVLLPWSERRHGGPARHHDNDCHALADAGAGWAPRQGFMDMVFPSRGRPSRQPPMTELLPPPEQAAKGADAGAEHRCGLATVNRASSAGAGEAG